MCCGVCALASLELKPYVDSRVYLDVYTALPHCTLRVDLVVVHTSMALSEGTTLVRVYDSVLLQLCFTYLLTHACVRLYNLLE